MKKLLKTPCAHFLGYSKALKNTKLPVIYDQIILFKCTTGNKMILVPYSTF